MPDHAAAGTLARLPMIRSAAFSPIMIEAALVFELISRGMIEESVTRSRSMPRTRSCGVDHRHRIDAHLAGADRVVVGLAEARA